MTTLVFQPNPAYLEGKQGKLPRNSKGHYKLLMGMYNHPNCVGDIYALTQRVKALFTNSTAASMVDRARLFGEDRHPHINDFILPGRSDEEAVAMLLARSADVPLDCRNHQIHKFWWEEMPHRVDGKTVYGVYGEIDPISAQIARSLDNPNDNTSMSVRSFIGQRNPTAFGNYILEQSDLVTWDQVPRPGFEDVGKYNTLGFESHKQLITGKDAEEFLITPDVIKELKRIAQASPQGFESDCMMINQMVKDESGRWLEKPDLVATLASRAWARKV